MGTDLERRAIAVFFSKQSKKMRHRGATLVTGRGELAPLHGDGSGVVAACVAVGCAELAFSLLPLAPRAARLARGAVASLGLVLPVTGASLQFVPRLRHARLERGKSRVEGCPPQGTDGRHGVVVLLRDDPRECWTARCGSVSARSLLDERLVEGGVDPFPRRRRRRSRAARLLVLGVVWLRACSLAVRLVLPASARGVVCSQAVCVCVCGVSPSLALRAPCARADALW